MTNKQSEQGFLAIIKQTLSDSAYLGDDCAYLKELGLYVTHDSMVQDVHFELGSTSAYVLGKKIVAVNLSDLAAAGAKPLYITISLSLPKKINAGFVKDFYTGVNEICEKHSVSVIGGDLTQSDKLFVSVCAIGKKVFDKEVSRSYAKPGDIVFVTGNHGDSAGGLRIILNHKENPYLTTKHLCPKAQTEKSEKIMKAASRNFAMMDSSDGLGDALFKIASDSEVSLDIDFSKIPVSSELKTEFPEHWKDLVLWGGEDFELVGCISENDFNKLDKNEFFPIGKVFKPEKAPVVTINDNNENFVIDETMFNKKIYKHFEE